MNGSPDLEDLRLVVAIAEWGSVGAAARLLRMSQPSASHRLGRLERRIGTALFERDTRGARATAAGHELSGHARRILEHLDSALAATHEAGDRRLVRVGVIASLADSVFPALGQALSLPVHHVVDHGARLIEDVAGGALDAAFTCLGAAPGPAAGVDVQRIGSDDLVVFVPAKVAPPGRGRLPFRDRPIAFATLDSAAANLHARLAALGGQPQRAGTVSTAMAMARGMRQLAVVPRSATRVWRSVGDRTRSLPWTHRVHVSVATRGRMGEFVVDAAPQVARALALGPREAEESGAQTCDDGPTTSAFDPLEEP